MERRGNRLREHGLSCPGRADHQHTALALAAGLHIETAVLDQPKNPAHLADRRLLASHIIHVHAEAGIVRNDHRLADPREDVKRPEEQNHVRDQEEEEVHQLSERRSQK